jgi:hypothetical protein
MALIHGIDYHYLETIETKEGFQKCEEYRCGEDADIIVSIEDVYADYLGYLGQFCIVCFLAFLNETYDTDEPF